MRQALEDVEAFHLATGQFVLGNDDRPGLTRRLLRWKLLKEEVEELETAMLENDLVGVADAYADIVYIVLGSALMHIGKERMIAVWDEVQRSNMAKCPDGKVSMREDGKILKPDDWTPPDIDSIVFGSTGAR